MEKECCYDVDPSVFFPYKRVLRGGKLKIFPLRDSKGNICGFDPSETTDSIDLKSVERSETKKGGSIPQIPPHLKRAQCIGSPAHPTLGDVDHIPLTAVVKKAITPTEEDDCRHLITPLQRLTAGKQDLLQRQLRARIKEMERENEKIVYPTPMCVFKKDGNILRKAYRIYKRDLQLEKERGTFKEKPKHFYDENTRVWYENMVKTERPCMNREIQELLNRTDCVTFPDAVNGSCFHCPERPHCFKVRR